jgi:hypothetical protein
LLRLTIAAPDDDAAALGVLHRWLRADEAGDGARMRLRPREGSDTMTALDVIEVVVPQVIGVLNLVVAVLAWRQSRATPPRVTLTTAAGSVTVEGHSALTAEQIVAALTPPSGEPPPADPTADRTGTPPAPDTRAGTPPAPDSRAGDDGSGSG